MIPFKSSDIDTILKIMEEEGGDFWHIYRTRFYCQTCGQHKDLCVCEGNKYGQRLDNSS